VWIWRFGGTVLKSLELSPEAMGWRAGAEC
jgi:hypothetical protein